MAPESEDGFGGVGVVESGGVGFEDEGGAGAVGGAVEEVGVGAAESDGLVVDEVELVTDEVVSGGEEDGVAVEEGVAGDAAEGLGVVGGAVAGGSGEVGDGVVFDV